MKFKYKEGVFVFLLVFVMLFNAIGLANSTLSYSMTDLPKGEWICCEPSPDGTKELNIYMAELEGVVTALRGEVSYLNEKGDEKTRNVYWQEGEKNVIATWKDAETVTINDKEIKIFGEPYDSRTQIILPEHSAKNRTINEE